MSGGKLVVVPTPVGNLGDMTPRALEVLSEAHMVLAEDTRTTGKLLRHFGSAKAIENASVEELSKIKGISASVARTIYDHLHTVND